MPTLNMVECAHTSASGARCTNPNGRSLLLAFAYECPNCGEYFHPEHHHERPTARRTQLCADCGTYHPPCYFVCRCDLCGGQTCGNFHHHTRLAQITIDGYAFAARAVDNNYYHGGLRPVTLDFRGDVGSHTLAQGPRYIGLEIEAENGGHFDLPDRFGIVEDGSLSSRGIEVLTPPSRGAALAERVKIAMDALLSAGYEATGRCGLHTHIDLRDKQNDQRFLSRLFAIGFATEDVLFSLQTEQDRHLGHYSIPLRNQYPFYCAKGPQSPDFEYIYNKLEKGSRGNRRTLNQLRQTKWGHRYLGFNFHSVFHRGTMEVRIHEGTLDADRILKWADLLQALIARAETKVSYRELLAMMNTKTKGVKIERMGKAFNLSDATLQYVETYSRPKLIEIPFGLDTPPRPSYL